MTDEKNTTPETAKPEPTLTNPVEQSFAEAERLAEQAEAAAKDEPCCDVPKAEEAAPEAPKTEVPTPRCFLHRFLQLKTADSLKN